MAGEQWSMRSRVISSKRAHRATRLLQQLIDRDDPKTLDWVIDTYGELLHEVPADRPTHAMALNNLGIALGLRYSRLGDLRDLDDQVRLCRLAVEVAKPKERPGRLSNLALGLGRKAAITRDPATIDEAAWAASAAVTEGGPRHPGHTLHLSTLAAVLAMRTQAGRAGDDLDASIATASAAVLGAPAGDPQLADHHGRFAGALTARYERDGTSADLDTAIEASRAALAATETATYRNRAGALPAFNAMLDRWTRQMVERNGTDREPPWGVRRSPDNPGITGFGGGDGPNPARAGRLLALSVRLLTRHAATTGTNGADLREALDGLDEVTATAVAPASVRLEAAERRAAALAGAGDVAGGLEAYGKAMDLLPLLAWRGIGQRDQQQRLRSHASLGRDAAACAIAAGDLERAVELLEQGRGVYWAQLLDTRTDLSALESAEPELAARLSACRQILESAEVTSARHQAARLFDELVDQVRRLTPVEGLAHPEEFLRPPAAARLLPPAGTGPIVLLNVSDLRCDALILTAAGVEAVPLPRVSAGEVAAVAGRYLASLDDAAGLDSVLTETLDWLWHRIAEPVLIHLGHSDAEQSVGAGGEEWERVWWCPTGLLTVLPVHAAAPAGGGGGVFDLVVSSYTPTVRALERARSSSESQRSAKTLVASLPRTPGQRSLPGAVVERRRLEELLGSDRMTVLDGEAADRAGLLSGLAEHRWFHASCHGTQTLADPSGGGLVPYDWETAGLVSVVDLADARHHDGELAFLSACRTATGGTGAPDEAITVAAAMQHAGWRHVIGTLWSIPDDTAAAVTRGFYSTIVRDGEPHAADAALALHHTLRRLRARDPRHPSAWAPFLHLGP